MPTLSLRPAGVGPVYRLTDPTGATTTVRGTQFRCYVRVPRRTSAVEGVIDTGSPFTVVPKTLWTSLVPGVDFDWLPTLPPGHGLVAGRVFTFAFARFLVPLAVEDYLVSVPRTGVVVQLADGDPLSAGASPRILVGLWGGLLDPSKLTLDNDPSTGRLAASLEFA